MSVTRCELRPGAYYDSVVLMQLQKGLLELPGVVDAGVVMATPTNQELLAESGLLVVAASDARPDDLLLVVKAESEQAAAGALAQVDDLLRRRRSSADQEFRPRSLEAALKMLPEAAWALVSVPGRYAAGVAREALRLRRHVFLYSDNVSLEGEIALKQEAQAKGLLVMGPDCGTAIINGVGLGFANRVRRGDVGLVGASGTGLQAITSHIHALGGGISQAIGTGGRDLSAGVGAVTTLQAIDLLARDEATRVMVLVSKPPAPEVAARVLAAAHSTGKDVVVYFIGYPPPGRHLGNLHFANSLTDAAEMAVKGMGDGEWGMEERSIHPSSLLPHPSSLGYARGLFAGGTLAYEATLALQAILTPLYSNAPVRPEQRLPDPRPSQGHTIVDLGADDFTIGRLHPMLDNDLRIRRLRQEAADPDVGLIMLDVVLGEGAHPDPAGELAPVISQSCAHARENGRSLQVIAIVVGTDEDPQDISKQEQLLADAGAAVFRNVAEAWNHVYHLYAGSSERPQTPPLNLDAFGGSTLAAVNVGLESFYDSLLMQGASAVQVEWKPPAGGNERLMAILAKMKKG